MDIPAIDSRDSSPLIDGTPFSKYGGTMIVSCPMARPCWYQMVTMPSTMEIRKNGAACTRSRTLTEPRFHQTYTRSTTGSATTDVLASIESRKNTIDSP